MGEDGKVGEAPAHYLGHRERLRGRVLAGGFAGAPDYEVLELYLFRSARVGDVKPKAKALLARFGWVGAVLAASLSELRSVPGVGEVAALDLKLAHELVQRVGREPIRRRTVIASWSALVSYVRLALKDEAREQVRLLFLDTKNQLILDEVAGHGTVNQAPLYPREVVRRALELSAASVNNHPSGDPTPSKADIEVTRAVIAAGKPLGIEVHDHLVVGREGVVSFKAKGLM